MKIIIRILFLILGFCYYANGEVFSLEANTNPILLKAKLDSDHHLYWKYPGQLGRPFQIDLSQSNNIASYQVLLPWPEPFKFEEQLSYVFPADIQIPIIIYAADSTKPVSFKAELSGTICSNKDCLLYNQELSKTFYAPVYSPNPDDDFTITQIHSGNPLRIEVATCASLENAEFALGVENSVIPGKVKRAGNNNFKIEFSFAPDLYEQIGSLATGEVFCKQLPVTKTIIIDNTLQISLIYAIFCSLAGGVILNFMPCILPVLSLKLLSLKRQQSRISILCYILGILATFNIIALLSITLQRFGHNFGFGMQFQNPEFISFMALVMLVLISISLERLPFNLFSNVANNVNNIALRFERKINYLFDFLAGVVAAMLSTSCSAPLLGLAISFGVTSTAVINLVIFNLIGIGFSVPYLLLLFFPNSLNRIPKAGPWLKYIKYGTTLLLVLTLLWLIYILYQQGGMRSALSLFALLILLKQVIESSSAFLSNKKVRSAIVLLLSGLCIYCPANLARQELVYNNYKDSLWQNFTQQTLEEALGQKQTVLVDVTANWCGTCQYNKMLVLDRSWTVNMLVDKKVINLRASLDRENPQAQMLMAAKKVYAIPLTIVYGPKAPNGIILPTVYSYKILKQAIEDAAAEQ